MMSARSPLLLLLLLPLLDLVSPAGGCFTRLRSSSVSRTNPWSCYASNLMLVLYGIRIVGFHAHCTGRSYYSCSHVIKNRVPNPSVEPFRVCHGRLSICHKERGASKIIPKSLPSRLWLPELALYGIRLLE